MPSYQSEAAPSRRLGAAVLVSSLLCLGAAPYEDPRRGFRVELPQGWALAPRFGDTQGMVFARTARTRRDSGLVHLMVRAESTAPTFTAFVAAMEEGLAGQPGFARVKEHKGRLAGQPALVREYRASVGEDLEKRIVAHYVPAGGRFFLVQYEGRARDVERVQGELKAMLDSFAVLDVAGGPAPRSSPVPAAVDEEALVGRWENDDGLVLVLGSDRGFVLGELGGRFEVDARTLTLVIPGKGRELFTFTLDAAAGTLVLESPNLDAPMTYRRDGARREKLERPSSAPAPASSSPEAGLRGRWRAAAGVELFLGSDGAFVLGPHRGRWSVEGSTLRLARSGAEVLSYRFRREGPALLLEGGDLDAALTFQRVSPE